MPTVWDKIYSNYLKGGEAYASLSQGIMPEFLAFLKKTNFPVKSVLDIGCGTGKYLKYLRSSGFKIAGIDSSSHAISMSRKLLGKAADLRKEEMYKYRIPKGKFDLILSVYALHHGTKKQIGRTASQFFSNLIPGGSIFITLTAYGTNKRWEDPEIYEVVGDGVAIPKFGPEKGLIHSSFKKEEIKKIFKRFKKLKLVIDGTKHHWVITGAKR